jgi:hypothetical protein
LLHSDEPAVAAASARAPAWLVRLQRSGVPGEVSDTTGEVARTRRSAQALVSAYPEWSSPLAPLVERLVALLLRGEGRLVPSHGDFHPKNVLLTPGITSVIDFDLFALREPAHDVGYAIGYLLMRSASREGDVAPGARAALAFWQRYARRGLGSWPRVAGHAARTCLEILHYTLCLMRSARVELLGVGAALMRRLLESDHPDTLALLARRGPLLPS